MIVSFVSYIHTLLLIILSRQSMAQASIRETSHVVILPLARIKPSAFQTRVNLENIDTLSSSIQRMGLLNPILVRRISSTDYEAISGHRRMEACRRIGLSEVPCVVRIASDKEAYLLSLTENLERETLDPIEEAEAFKRFVCEYGWGSISELATRIGRSEEFVSQRILMLGLPPSVMEKIKLRTLTQSHAEELVWIKNPELQISLSEQIVKKHLSVSQTHDIARLIKSGCELGRAIDLVDSSEVSVPDFLKFKSQKRNRNSSRIKRALVSLRTSLSVLDLIIEEMIEDDTESARVLEVMKRSRYVLHQVIDDIVREKVGLAKVLGKS